MLKGRRLGRDFLFGFVFFLLVVPILGTKKLISLCVCLGLPKLGTQNGNQKTKQIWNQERADQEQKKEQKLEPRRGRPGTEKGSKSGTKRGQTRNQKRSKNWNRENLRISFCFALELSSLFPGSSPGCPSHGPHTSLEQVVSPLALLSHQ